MLNYAVSYKGTTSLLGESCKMSWEERRKHLIEKLRSFFSERELKEIEHSNKYILIDDSGNEVIYLLAPYATK